MARQNSYPNDRTVTDEDRFTGVDESGHTVQFTPGAVAAFVSAGIEAESITLDEENRTISDGEDTLVLGAISPDTIHAPTNADQTLVVGAYNIISTIQTGREFTLADDTMNGRKTILVNSTADPVTININFDSGLSSTMLQPGLRLDVIWDESADHYDFTPSTRINGNIYLNSPALGLDDGIFYGDGTIQRSAPLVDEAARTVTVGENVLTLLPAAPERYTGRRQVSWTTMVYSSTDLSTQTFTLAASSSEQIFWPFANHPDGVTSVLNYSGGRQVGDSYYPITMTAAANGETFTFDLTNFREANGLSDDFDISFFTGNYGSFFYDIDNSDDNQNVRDWITWLNTNAVGNDVTFNLDYADSARDSGNYTLRLAEDGSAAEWQNSGDILQTAGSLLTFDFYQTTDTGNIGSNSGSSNSQVLSTGVYLGIDSIRDIPITNAETYTITNPSGATLDVTTLAGVNTFDIITYAGNDNTQLIVDFQFSFQRDASGWNDFFTDTGTYRYQISFRAPNDRSRGVEMDSELYLPEGLVSDKTTRADVLEVAGCVEYVLQPVNVYNPGAAAVAESTTNTTSVDITVTGSTTNTFQGLNGVSAADIGKFVFFPDFPTAGVFIIQSVIGFTGLGGHATFSNGVRETIPSGTTFNLYPNTLTDTDGTLVLTSFDGERVFTLQRDSMMINKDDIRITDLPTEDPQHTGGLWNSNNQLVLSGFAGGDTLDTTEIGRVDAVSSGARSNLVHPLANTNEQVLIRTSSTFNSGIDEQDIEFVVDTTSTTTSSSLDGRFISGINIVYNDAFGVSISRNFFVSDISEVYDPEGDTVIYTSFAAVIDAVIANTANSAITWDSATNTLTYPGIESSNTPRLRLYASFNNVIGVSGSLVVVPLISSQQGSFGTARIEFDPDIANTVYDAADEIDIFLTANQGADASLTEIANAITALDANITWDGTITDHIGVSSFKESIIFGNSVSNLLATAPNEQTVNVAQGLWFVSQGGTQDQDYRISFPVGSTMSVLNNNYILFSSQSPYIRRVINNGDVIRLRSTFGGVESFGTFEVADIVAFSDHLPNVSGTNGYSFQLINGRNYSGNLISGSSYPSTNTLSISLFFAEEEEDQRQVAIQLGTSNIDSMLTYTRRSSTISSLVLENVNPGEEPNSTYTVADYAGNQISTFTSSVASSTDSDLATVLNNIVTAVNNNTETPTDFYAYRRDNNIVLSSDEGFSSTGSWSITANHGAGTGNIAFALTQETQSAHEFDNAIFANSVKFDGLPTTDPGISGFLWNTGNNIVASGYTADVQKTDADFNFASLLQPLSIGGVDWRIWVADSSRSVFMILPPGTTRTGSISVSTGIVTIPNNNGDDFMFTLGTGHDLELTIGSFTYSRENGISSLSAYVDGESLPQWAIPIADQSDFPDGGIILRINSTGSSEFRQIISDIETTDTTTELSGASGLTPRTRLRDDLFIGRLQTATIEGRIQSDSGLNIGELSVADLPTTDPSIPGRLFTQTATELGGTGTTKVICVS